MKHTWHWSEIDSGFIGGPWLLTHIVGLKGCMFVTHHREDKHRSSYKTMEDAITWMDAIDNGDEEVINRVMHVEEIALETTQQEEAE